MKALGLLVAAALFSGQAVADPLVAARTLRAQTLITPEDLARGDTPIDGALEDPAAAIGRETRVAIYAGRPIRAEDLAAPAIIERNQIVPLVFRHGGLSIQTEGRALERAGAGDTIRVLNLSSKTTLMATVGNDGAVHVLSP